MNKNNGNQHYLPSREFAYDYTVAMYFAQLLESNMRAILKIQDDHCYGRDIELDEDELKRFKSINKFINKAALGALIKKLEKTGTVNHSEAWAILERACPHRNKLAHSFLAEQNFDAMTKKDEANAIRQLHDKAIDLCQAFFVSGLIRKQAETLSKKELERAEKLFEQFEI